MSQIYFTFKAQNKYDDYLTCLNDYFDFVYFIILFELIFAN